MRFLSLFEPRVPVAPLLALVLGLGATSLSSLARADEAVIEGTVVAIDHGDLVLDLGSQRGAVAGDRAEIYRPLVLRHPLTGKPLRDRFLIGHVVLGQVRTTLSLADVQGEISRPAAIGDIVVLPRKAPGPLTKAPRGPAPKTKATDEEPSSQEPTPVAPAAPAPSAAAPLALGAPEGSDDAALSALLASVTGADPATRASRYEAAAKARPQSRFATVLREEAAALRRAHPTSTTASAPRILGLELPERLLAGKPFALALRAAYTYGVVVHVRAEGAAAFTSLPAKADGFGYFRVTLPAELLVGSAIGLFVEGSDEKGETSPLVGTAASPVRVSVEPIGGPTASLLPPGTTAQASVFAEYARYDFPSNQDRAFQTEGSFGLRFERGQLRAVRSGFGVYRGVGGTLQELDVEKLPGRPVGITYGWLEAEWAPWGNTASLIGRAVVGVGRGGVNGGGQGFVRIGHDRRTNLLLGGEILGGVGLRGVAELTWSALPRVPITLRTEVTNQPAGLAPRTADTSLSQGRTEIGARGIVQVGYRFTPSLVAFGRASYQGRTIHHAGPGLGAGVTYEW